MTQYQIDKEEWERYLRQGLHNLRSAEDDMGEGDYDWACFKAEQAAELFIKGFFRAMGKMAVGHSLLKLLRDFAEMGMSVPEDIKGCSSELDKIYIPSRYPDAYALGAPVDYYSKENAVGSIDCARKILDFVREMVDA